MDRMGFFYNVVRFLNMPSIVLRDSIADAGFLLVAGDDPLSTKGQRDVILMSLPLPNNSELAAFIRQHKHTEFTASISSSAGGYDLAFSVTHEQKVSLHIESDGNGYWSVAGIGQGTCMVLAHET